jgi:6-phosphogluconate dehydrogenase
MGVTISRKNKLPDLLNTKRSKSKTKLNLEFRNVLIHYIKVKLTFNNHSTSYNYMDSYVEDICTLIANDLRDGFGHNVWFDLKNGIFYFFVAEN